MAWLIMTVADLLASSTDSFSSGSATSRSLCALESWQAQSRLQVVSITGSPCSHRSQTNDSSATSPVRQHILYVKLRLICAGWLTVIGWIAALTSVCYFVADLILQLATLNDSDQSFQRANWHATLLLWAVLLLCVFINIFVSGALPTIEVVVLIVHILGFFGILVPLVYLSGSHNSAKLVFTTFNNGGKWSTQTLAFFVGLQGNALAFVGTDSVVHVSGISLTQGTQLNLADVGGSEECKRRCSSVHATKPNHQRNAGYRHAPSHSLQRRKPDRTDGGRGCPNRCLHSDFPCCRGIECWCNNHGQHHHLP